MPAPVVAFALIDVVPHIAARETHERPREFSVINPKGLFSTQSARSGHSARRFSTFRTDGNVNCAGRRLAAGGGIASKISGEEAIEAFPLSRRAVLQLFRVRCSANRSGDPIVAGKRPNTYAINYPELQAWIEIAHRPLIEVDDAARR